MLFWNVLALLLLLLTARGMLTKSKKLHNFCYWFAVLILVLVSVLRFDIGRDYMTYWGVIPFGESFTDILAGRNVDMEFFARLFYGITVLFEWPPLFFILIGVVIYYFSFYAIYKNTENPFVGFWVFWCLLYPFSLNGLRQAAAMAIILYAYPYIRDKKLYNYILFVFLAFLFHRSALCAVLFYPLYHYCSLNNAFISCIVLVLLSNIIVQFLFSNFYSQYLDKVHDFFEGNETRQWLQLFSIILIYLWHITVKGLTEEQKKMLPLLMIGAVMPFVLGSHFGVRMSLYCFVFATIFFADFVPAKGLKTQYRVVLILLLVSYTLVGIANSRYNDKGDDFIPYNSIFSQKAKQQEF